MKVMHHFPSGSNGTQAAMERLCLIKYSVEFFAMDYTLNIASKIGKI